MTQFASDNFTDINGTVLSTHDALWTKVTGFTDTLEIYNNRLKVSVAGGTSAAYRYATVPDSADYEVSAQFYIVAASDTSLNTGVIARASSSQQTMYMARWRPSNGFSLFKFVNSATATQLGSSVAQSYSIGTTAKIRLRVEGTTISVYRGDETSPIISVTDSSITSSGFPGIWTNNYQTGDGPQLDNFSADTLSSTSTYTLTLDNGSYLISGSAILTPIQVSIPLDTASYSITGQDVSLINEGSYILTLDSGIYNITSSTANVGIGSLLESGTYTVTGRNIILTSSNDPIILPTNSSGVSVSIRVGL